MNPPVGTATVAQAIGPAVTTRDVIAAYVGLTKPRIVELLLVTTLPAMFLAAGGVPSLRIMLVTLVGGYLAAGSANTYNNVIDADIDELMRRTRSRALPRHRVSRQAAAVYGTVLGAGSVLVLGFGANWLSAWLALLANGLYVFVYTMWLKRLTSQNIVWGGIAGCFPPLIGWTAVTGSIAWPPIVLFAIVFFWTPPHTWALAWRYREDYAAGGVPMLPVVATREAVARRILVYSVLTVAHEPGAVAGRAHELAVPAGRRVVRRVAGRRVRAAAPARPCGRRRRRGQADAAVPLVQRLPGPRLRGGCPRPMAPLGVCP